MVLREEVDPYPSSGKPLCQCLDMDELHDILVMANRFIEVSKEFSGIKSYQD